MRAPLVFAIALLPAAARAQDAGPSEGARWREAEAGGYDVTLEGFEAHVDERGNLTLAPEKKSSILDLFPCPSCVAKQMAKDLVEYAKDPMGYQKKVAAELDAPGMLGLPKLSRLPPLAGEVTPQRESYAVMVPLFRMQFDETGTSPRDLLRERRLREATVHRRDALATRARDRDLRAAPNTVTGRLESLWARRDLSPAARRALIFELWDDSAESGEPDVVDAGRRARAAINLFVRRALPVGSPDAFSPDELDALNRRRGSRASFDPYCSD